MYAREHEVNLCTNHTHFWMCFWAIWSVGRMVSHFSTSVKIHRIVENSQLCDSEKFSAQNIQTFLRNHILHVWSFFCCTLYISSIYSANFVVFSIYDAWNILVEEKMWTCTEKRQVLMTDSDHSFPRQFFQNSAAHHGKFTTYSNWFSTASEPDQMQYLSPETATDR